MFETPSHVFQTFLAISENISHVCKTLLDVFGSLHGLFETLVYLRPFLTCLRCFSNCLSLFLKCLRPFQVYLRVFSLFETLTNKSSSWQLCDPSRQVREDLQRISNASSLSLCNTSHRVWDTSWYLRLFLWFFSDMFETLPKVFDIPPDDFWGPTWCIWNAFWSANDSVELFETLSDMYEAIRRVFETFPVCLRPILTWRHFPPCVRLLWTCF